MNNKFNRNKISNFFYKIIKIPFLINYNKNFKFQFIKFIKQWLTKIFKSI
jgi:hypothetical protein